MQSPLPLTRDLVLIGGGHTHALVLRMWGMRPLPGVRLTLISPDPMTTYSGMLPGFIAGHYPFEALQIDLVRLARFAGARLILDRADGIDRIAREVIVGDRRIGYDFASINVGITSAMPDLPGFSRHATPAKPLEQLAERWCSFLASAPRNPKISIIGGGVAGVELAMASAHRLGPTAKVTFIEAGPVIVPDLPARTRARILARLDEMAIKLVVQDPVTELGEGMIALKSGREVATDFTLGAAAATPPSWLTQTELALTDGYISVDAKLRSLTDPEIFAVGDVAHLTHAPRPKAGVFAVREAPVLFHNLRVALSGQGQNRAYRPQKDYLKLISLGAKLAVADRFGLSFHGAMAWRWKDRIDRKFMAKFGKYPDMARPKLPTHVAAGLREMVERTQPICGGCGAKVGKLDLRAVLNHVPATQRKDVMRGVGDDAAVLQLGRHLQVLTTDHMRAFTLDYGLLAQIVAVHALGDVWAMGARPQVALMQLTLPPLSPELQRRTLSEITAAAAKVFGDAGADIVGGHTSVGAELTLGFTVTGLAASKVIDQSGAKAGDVLILTKPIGAGVILAAEMAGAATGTTVAGLLGSMTRPQGAASAILAPWARAMTDVTGFGLAGHLMGILDASDVAAELVLDQIPVLEGADALAAAGHGSSLLPANKAAAARVSAPPGPRTDLLFDPQTAGGLLAAVPAKQAQVLLAELIQAGEQAAIIGRLTDGPPAISCV